MTGGRKLYRDTVRRVRLQSLFATVPRFYMFYLVTLSADC